MDKDYPVVILGHFLEKYESRRKYTDLTLNNEKKLSPVYITPINEYSDWRKDFGETKNYLTNEEKVYKLNLVVEAMEHNGDIQKFLHYF